MVDAFQTLQAQASQTEVRRADALPVLFQLLAQQQAVPDLSHHHSSDQRGAVRDSSLLLPRLLHA